MAELQSRFVSSNLSRDDVTDEDNLLIEAVSLLVRRQRDTESWVAEQISQAEARAVAGERRSAALESRLAGIEDQLDRLVRQVEPGRGDVDLDARLARLRAQVQGLKEAPERSPAVASNGAEAGAGSVPLSPRALGEANHVSQAPLPVASSAAAVGQMTSPAAADAPSPSSPSAAAAGMPKPPPSNSTVAAPTAGVQPGEASSSDQVANHSTSAATGRGGQFSSFLQLLGDTPEDRFGLLLIGAGLIAVVYAVLSQLHLG
jgi:hypothetical protein